MINKNIGNGLGFLLISMVLLFYASCEKQEDIIEKDSVLLMSELKGKWNLVSMRQILLETTDGGFSWQIDSDDTLSATGELNITSVNERYYNGSISIIVDTINEAHTILGHAYKNTIDERIYIDTEDQSNIEAFLLYSGESAVNMFFIDDRDPDHFVMWKSEINESYSRQLEKHFMFERAK